MPEIIQDQFSVEETDNTFTLGSTSWDSNFRDRARYEREKLLIQAINAWRSNPIARRIIEITTEFALGDGFTFECRSPKARRVLAEFWAHPLNNLEAQLPEWADEAWRSGDLFLLFSVDGGGGCYVRAVPAEQISAIETAPNDYRQETAYLHGEDQPPYPVYDPTGRQGSFMLHFPLARAVGASFGESDLVPVLHWIGLYRNWLEDRARLNFGRQMFTFILQRKFESSPEKTAYLNQFKQSLPRTSGGVIALDQGETLSVVEPQLASHEAGEDGLALKRMIAIGAGIPLHYLAEPEESTRTTAEAADTPTFKRFKRRQAYLRDVVRVVLQTVLEVNRRFDPNLPGGESARVQVNVPDITERDNASLAIGVQRIVNAFAPIYNAKLIDEKEFIRLVYRFLAETPPAATGAFSPVNLRGTTRPPEARDPGSSMQG